MTALLELGSAVSSPLTHRVMQPQFVSADDAERDSVKVYHGGCSKRKSAGVFVTLVVLFLIGYNLLNVHGIPKATEFKLAGAGLMLIGAAGIASVVYELKRKQRVFILKDSFAIERRFSSEVELIKWTDITKLYVLDRTTRTHFHVLFIPVGKSDYHQGRIRIALVDGRQLVISNRLRSFSDMANQIISRTTAVQLVPSAQFVMDGGGTLDFDKFSLANNGLVYKGKLLSWSDIERVSLSHGGILMFRMGKRWRSPRFSLETIPNASLLLELLPILGVPCVHES